jgi:L-threonylcarbamoyladenylate synthase
MQTLILPITDSNSLAHALDVLTGGGLVAFPTDTVYGLGALAFDANAVSKIYIAKGRGQEKAIPILISDIDQIHRVAAGVNRIALALGKKFWPGPLTIVVPRHSSIPDVVSPLPTVGVRIPNLNVSRELLRLTGPLAVTSANASGQTSPSTAKGVHNQLEGKIPLILDGGVTPGGIPSTVVDCTGEEPAILREGPISLEDILSALEQP